MKKLEFDEFVRRARSKHGDRYQYLPDNFDGATKYTTIICPVHGVFKQVAEAHYRGQGCPRCRNDSASDRCKMPFDEFVRRSRIEHGDRYEYLSTIYDGTGFKTQIVCPDHGMFEQLAMNHLVGHGCPKCAEIVRCRKRRSSTREFIEKARRKHGNRYGYSRVEYVDAHTNVIIICQNHGEFAQTPNGHLGGHGCPTCKPIIIGNKKRSNAQEFIKKAKRIHGNKYGYEKVEYARNDAEVIIICQDHGEFQQTPKNHLGGQGCPICKHKGEANVGAILLDMFQRVARQAPLRIHRRTYKFDFQIQDFARLIYVEYHGEQHYRPVDFAGKGDEWAAQQFSKIQRHDQIKADWCKRNSYPLIVIPYWVEDVRSYIVESLRELQIGDNEK